MNGAVGLGATLYFPATRADLARIARGHIEGLRSAVVCLEDAVAPADRGLALIRLERLLLELRAAPPAIRLYVRPHDPGMLSRIARMAGIDAVEGFVLPKANAGNLRTWLGALPPGEHRLMPTIEGIEAFDAQELRRLRDALLPHRERVTAVRIGGNDVLGLLGVRRSRVRTAWEGPLANVLRDVAGTFLPAGFELAAPVFEHYGAPEVLAREVEIDLEHGLCTKTAIHPSQLAIVHAAYRPDPDELDDARAILAVDAPAVFGRRQSLCEPATHRGWARRTLQRADAYGVPSEAAAPETVRGGSAAQRSASASPVACSDTPRDSKVSSVSPPVGSPRSVW